MSRGPGKGHDATRQAIVETACEVVAAQGVEALTFRRVATAAEVSHGRVQHYFPDRAALVRAAFDAVQERTRRRVEDALTATGSPSALEVVAAVLRAMIPQDRRQLDELRVVAAFETLTLTEPALQEALRIGHAHLVRLITDQVARAVDHGEPHRKVDPAQAAATVLATAEGLSGQVLHGHCEPAQALRLLDAALGTVVGAAGTARPAGVRPGGGEGVGDGE
jgi:AcrR family transcriptional regulator